MIADQEKDLRNEAASCVEDLTAESQLFDVNAEILIPRFDPEECIVGRELGTGGFSIVYEIEGLSLYCNKNATNSEARAEVAMRSQRQGQSRYALKRLKNATIRKASSQNEDTQHQFVAGVTDLAMEVKFLTVLSHPHIIKMRGISAANLCSKDAFIIIDRLHQTLDERIHSWRGSSRRLSGGLGLVIDSKGRKKDKIFVQRLSAAYGICSAVEFLHSLRIVYRDLKPDNIGFDIRDDIKIFDFGLARELDQSQADGGDNDVYIMSSEVGSLRYMSPEVYFRRPYNRKVDTYAFGLILWQLCHLETPYYEYTSENFREFVFERGVRPKINNKASMNSMMLLSLQTRCWSTDLAERPEFSEIKDILRDEILKYDECAESELDFSNKTQKSMAGDE